MKTPEPKQENHSKDAAKETAPAKPAAKIAAPAPQAVDPSAADKHEIVETLRWAIGVANALIAQEASAGNTKMQGMIERAQKLADKFDPPPPPEPKPDEASAKSGT